MENMLIAIEQALSNENWYAALALTLMLPDICGKIQTPKSKSKPRYISWYNTYLLEKYRVKGWDGLADHVFLSGKDCYALRCAFLHAGNGNLRDHVVAEVLQRVHFHISDPAVPIKIHKMQANAVLQLDLEMFCGDFIATVREWLKSNPAVPFADLLDIAPFGSGSGLSLSVSVGNSGSGVIDFEEEQRAVIPQAGE